MEKTTDLEWTAFHTGWFLDYWAIPQIKSNMTPITTVIDIPHHAAGIPGSGEVPVAFTHTTDVAKFVAASLHLEKWEHRSFIVGDKVTWNEFLRLAEQATGKPTPSRSLSESFNAHEWAHLRRQVRRDVR